jgi:Flp pilus assembly pilin Flp
MIKQVLEYYNAKLGINQEGATAVEYAVMMGLIAAIIIATVTTLGLATEGIFADLLARWP